jgi:hypothetical protein
MRDGLLDVLVLAGQMTAEHSNAHRSFRLHHQLVTTVLESTGRFRVRVTEEVHGLGAEMLDPYDAVVVIHEGREHYHRDPDGLGATTDASLIELVRDKGRGIVWFHSSCVQEPGWGWPEEYAAMRGAALQPARTLRKIPADESVVTTAEPRHAITEGLPATWNVTNDDLLVPVELLPGARALVTVLDDLDVYPSVGWPPAHVPIDVPEGGVPELPGIGQHQPLVWINEWGAGRSFTCTLGHDVDTFRRMPFLPLLVRGTEWAATGEVTLPLPDRTGPNRFVPWPYY